MNKGKLVLIITGVVVLLGLFMWPKLNDPNRGVKQVWAEEEIDCLAGHSRVNLHIHPHLAILVDDQPVNIPANVGVLRDCMAEVHTHDDSGTIHVESLKAGATFTLEQFFTVWGEESRKDGYDIEVSVDDQPTQELEGLVFKDKQNIVLKYYKKK